MMKNDNSVKLKRAKKRVKELKGFYTHLTVYMVVNTFISAVKIYFSMRNGAGFEESIFTFDMVAVWFFWGVGLFFHGLKVFKTNVVFGRNWEEKQIEKYLNKEKKEVDKYR